MLAERNRGWNYNKGVESFEEVVELQSAGTLTRNF